MMQAIKATRPGGYVGYVGVPHGVALDGQPLFFSHVHLHGGPAPVRKYLSKLIDLVFNGSINPGKVFDLVLPLDQVAEGAMTRDTKTKRQAGRSVLRTALATPTLSFVRASAATPGGHMEIKRSGAQPSAKGPAEWFTGTVRIDPLFDAPVPARAAGASVTFEPGARTAWHTHPLGQTLVVISGVGRAQRWGGPIEEIRPGDVVWFSPGEKHWHGAAPTTAMTHIAIQEKLDGKPVDWLEHVTPEQYEGQSGGS